MNCKRAVVSIVCAVLVIMSVPELALAQSGQYVCLKTRSNRFVASEHNNERAMSNRSSCGPWETVRLMDVNGPPLRSGDIVHVRTNRNTYWGARPDGSLRDNIARAQSYERFEIVKTGAARGSVILMADSISLRSVTFNRWVYDGGTGRVTASARSVGAGERFRLVAAASSMPAIPMCLRTRSNRFFSAVHGGVHVETNRTSCGAWERLAIVDIDGGALRTGDLVAIRTGRGTFFSARSDGTLRDNARVVQPWEQFEIRAHGASSGSVLNLGRRVSLRSMAHNRFIYDGGVGRARASSRSAGAGELFTVTGVPTVPFKGTSTYMPTYRKAQSHGKWPCPSGFRDPRNGGECWRCPSGYKRTIYAVTASNACEKYVGAHQMRARKHSRPRPGCPGGQFFDAWDWGWCWSCPSGTHRTVHHVNSWQACERRAYTTHHRASYLRKAGCRSGQFHDPRNGGECWSCPANYNRTVMAVTTGRACKLRGGGVCSSVFNTIKDLIPKSAAPGYLAGRCALSFTQGVVCKIPDILGAMGMPGGGIACKNTPPVVAEICGMFKLLYPGIHRIGACLQKAINAAITSGATFSPSGLTDSVCRSVGDVLGALAAVKLAKRLGIRIKGKMSSKFNVPQKLKDLMHRLSKARVIRWTGRAARYARNANMAATPFDKALQACIAAF